MIRKIPVMKCRHKVTIPGFISDKILILIFALALKNYFSNIPPSFFHFNKRHSYVSSKYIS